MFRVSVLTAAALLVASASSTNVRAQSSVLNSIYGEGVHAYFNHHYDQAYQHFSTAINNGYEDPRAYYFRGLAAEASGRPLEAESDWQAGAELEARGRINGNIGRALARIQGHQRAEIEEIRRKARIQQMIAEQAAARQGRQAAPRPGDRSMSEPAPARPAPRRPAPAPAPPRDDDPFEDDAPEEAQLEMSDALEDAAPGDETPFGTDGEPADAEPAPAPDDAGGDEGLFDPSADDAEGGLFDDMDSGSDDGNIFGDSPF